MEMAFPTEKYLAYIRVNGKPPTFRLSACRRFGGYGDYKTVEAEAKDPSSKDAAALITALNQAFQGEDVGNN